MKKLALTLLVSAALAACSGGQHAPKMKPPACDRSCLEKLINTVLEAMRTHDPGRLQTNGNLQYVENNQALKPGEGSWRTIQSFGSYRQYLADPEGGNAALITTMRENDEDGLFTLRIHAAGRRLAEAEVTVTHTPQGARNYAKLGKPEAQWSQVVPPDERMSREDLAATVNKYYGAMENNDGKGDYSFFADDCNRQEHGLQTTNQSTGNYGLATDSEFVTLSCRGQFESGFLGYITRVRDRRYEVIDTERGVVFAIATLDHNGTVREIPLTNGNSIKVPSYFSASRSLEVGEAFRIRDGKIQDIETTLHEYPYGMRTGFRSTFDPPRDVPDGQPPVAGQHCDRSCLEGLLDQLVAAMLAHDPRKAPLSDQLTYRENDQRLALRDGLWTTLTEVGSYRLHLADPTRGEAAFIGRVNETDLPGLLVLRIQSVGRRISDIEATLVREERPGAEELYRVHPPVEADPAALRTPEALFLQNVAPDSRSTRDEILAVINRYFDAVSLGHGGELPFAEDCARHENGVLVTGNPDLPRAPQRGQDARDTQWQIAAAGENPQQPFSPYALDCAAQLASGYSAYVERIRDRRLELVDEERGLALVAAYYDVPGTLKQVTNSAGQTLLLPPVLGRPHTLATRQLFKIAQGQIRRIDVASKPQPYGQHPDPQQ